MLRGRVSVPQGPANRHLWRIRLPPESHVESFHAFAALLRNFAELASRGAFASSGEAAWMSRARIEREHIEFDEGSIEAIVHIEECDPRYGRPLRNIIFGIGEVMEVRPIEFGIEPADHADNTVELVVEIDPGEVGAGLFYPTFSAPPGLSIARNRRGDRTSQRTVSFYFRDSLAAHSVREMSELVDQWATILDVGYATSEEDLEEGRSFFLNAIGSQHDDHTFVVHIGEFNAAEDAMTPLINLLMVCTWGVNDLTNIVIA